MTGDRIQCNLSAFHVTRLASVDFVTQGAFLKLSVNCNLHFEQKQGQRIAVNCLLEGRDVFAVMPTGFGKSFIVQLFSTTIEEKKISEGKHPNSVILVICPLLSVKWG